VTVACSFPDTTVGRSGADGTVLGTITADSGDGRLVSSSFVAVTVHVYVLPLVTPVTTMGDATPGADEAVPPSDDAHDAS
jgi:hypothetical protein